MTSDVAGYSGTPLSEKLGLKAGGRLVAINAPEGYGELLGPPPGATITDELAQDELLIHYFAGERAALAGDFLALKLALAPSGALWISWPKRAAKVKTDLDESAVREIGLAHGLVDVKVAAVSAIWSGLKFVYRLADRP
jgi:hypothetical protein